MRWEETDSDCSEENAGGTNGILSGFEVQLVLGEIQGINRRVQ